jgi:hypothetical protein
MNYDILNYNWYLIKISTITCVTDTRPTPKSQQFKIPTIQNPNNLKSQQSKILTIQNPDMFYSDKLIILIFLEQNLRFITIKLKLIDIFFYFITKNKLRVALLLLIELQKLN